jgi:transketolase
MDLWSRNDIGTSWSRGGDKRNALASHWLSTRYNKPDFHLFDYDVYALAGDGCMMEGISGEAASLAGHLGLSNLCWLYDNNHITIEGHTALAFSEDVAGRFLAYGWNVERVSNANDLDLLREAFDHFKKTTDRPTLIVVDSHIGYGAPTKQDTSAAHGETARGGGDQGHEEALPVAGLREVFGSL